MMYDGELAAHGLSVAELARRDRGLAVLDDDADRRVPRRPAADPRRAHRLRARAGGRGPWSAPTRIFDELPPSRPASCG